MWVNGRVPRKVLEKQKAQQVYEDEKSRGNEAGLSGKK